LRRDNGFTLIEVLIAMSIFIMIAITIVPIYTLVETERKHLYDKRHIINGLHDELQQWIVTEQLDRTWTKKMGHRDVTLQFMTENERMKGCA